MIRIIILNTAHLIKKNCTKSKHDFSSENGKIAVELSDINDTTNLFGFTF